MIPISCGKLKISVIRLLTTFRSGGFTLLAKKQETMKKYLIPVWTVTGYLLVYVVAIGLELHIRLILFMFSISPILILWMVYRVLKADVKVDHTFDEKWYEDLSKRD